MESVTKCLSFLQMMSEFVKKVPMEIESSISLGETVLELENATLSALIKSLFLTGLLYSIVRKDTKQMQNRSMETTQNHCLVTCFIDFKIFSESKGTDSFASEN